MYEGERPHTPSHIAYNVETGLMKSIFHAQIKIKCTLYYICESIEKTNFKISPM